MIVVPIRYLNKKCSPKKIMAKNIVNSGKVKAIV